MTKIHIRAGRKSDLPAIRAWLEEEEVRDVHGNFLCNWNIIANSDALYVATVGDRIVGYQVGALVQSGILQVREEWRHRGVGTALVRYLIALNKRRGNWLLRVQCKPRSSIDFWKRMGFTIDESANGFLALTAKLRQPKGEPVGVVITFYPEQVKWKPETPPLSTHTVEGVLKGGKVYLPRPVVQDEGTYVDVRDMVVRIEVDGVERYRDKARYERAGDVGIRSCRGGFWLKTVILK